MLAYNITYQKGILCGRLFPQQAFCILADIRKEYPWKVAQAGSD